MALQAPLAIDIFARLCASDTAKKMNTSFCLMHAHKNRLNHTFYSDQLLPHMDAPINWCPIKSVTYLLSCISCPPPHWVWLCLAKRPSRSSSTAPMRLISFPFNIKNPSLSFSLCMSLSLFLLAIFFAASFAFWQSHTQTCYSSITLRLPCWLRWQLKPLPNWLAVKHHFVPVTQMSSPDYVSLSLPLAKGQCFSIWISWSLYFPRHPPPNQPSPPKKKNVK